MDKQGPELLPGTIIFIHTRKPDCGSRFVDWRVMVAYDKERSRVFQYLYDKNWLNSSMIPPDVLQAYAESRK